MLDDTTSSWWYEQDGAQAGPVTAAGIARLVAEGRLGPSHRVWRDGMAGWEPLSSVTELAPALPAARPPPPPPQPTFAAPPRGPSGPPSGATRAPAGWGQPPPGVAGTAAAFEEVSVAGVLLLSVVTLGIYGLVRFHQTGRAYEALAARPSTFSRNFWLFVGLGIGGFVVNAATSGFGLPLTIASLVFQVLTLDEALALRRDGLRRAGIQPALTGDGTHRALLILGLVLSFALVGIVLLLVQAAKWFSDWNAVGAALRGGSSAGPVR